MSRKFKKSCHQHPSRRRPGAREYIPAVAVVAGTPGRQQVSPKPRCHPNSYPPNHHPVPCFVVQVNCLKEFSQKWHSHGHWLTYIFLSLSLSCDHFILLGTGDVSGCLVFGEDWISMSKKSSLHPLPVIHTSPYPFPQLLIFWGFWFPHGGGVIESVGVIWLGVFHHCFSCSTYGGPRLLVDWLAHTEPHPPMQILFVGPGVVKYKSECQVWGRW